MSRLVKCLYCEKTINRQQESFVQKNSRYAHTQCDQEHNREQFEREGLTEYIIKLFGDRVNFGMVGKQIKNFSDDYEYTLSGIKGTLYYCYEVKKMNINMAQGIGIVPYYYNEAKNYFEKVEKQRLNIGVDFTPYNKKSIYIKSPRVSVLKPTESLDDLERWLIENE